MDKSHFGSQVASRGVPIFPLQGRCGSSDRTNRAHPIRILASPNVCSLRWWAFHRSEFDLGKWYAFLSMRRERRGYCGVMYASRGVCGYYPRISNEARPTKANDAFSHDFASGLTEFEYEQIK